jgi:Uma2 family endonuclease
MNRGARRRSPRPALATTLLLLWILVVGTAVPFGLFLPLRELLEPLCPPLAAVVRPYITSVIVFGSSVAVHFMGVLAAVFGWEIATPPRIDPWMLAAIRIGELSGIAVGALVPTWLIALWAWRGRKALPPRVSPMSNPANVPALLTIAWTLLIAQPLVGLVGRAAFPVETWLMLPPLAASRDTTDSLASWCPYHLHESAFACEAHLMTSHALKVQSVYGFGFAGARCVSAADVPEPGWYDRVVEHLKSRLASVVGPRADVRARGDDALRDIDGDPDIALFEAKSTEPGQAPHPLLVVEVLDSGRVGNAMARYAAAGIPEIWVISRGSSAGDDSVQIWSRPDSNRQRYAKLMAVSTSTPFEVEPVAFPGTRLTTDDLMPPVCPTG